MELQNAMFGAGCFWCVEDDFRSESGVLKAVSGYSGGEIENPTYEQVCTGKTGHAEVVWLEYDPEKITYEDLVVKFFSIHDPTTLNRQGPDVGTQYRSVIFYFDQNQQKTAHKIIDQLSRSGKFPSTIITQVSPASTFYPAEEYHQQYYCKIREKNLR